MTPEKLHRAEIVLLSLLVLVLPSLEALKTFFWFSYLCVFLYSRFREGRLSLLPIQFVNIAIALFLLATLASTIINWPFDNGFKGFADEIRFCTLFLCLYSAGYSAKEYRQLAIFIVVGVMGGLAYGLVEFLLYMRANFQFHSAGVLTQSSIYLGIAILLNTGLLLDKENGSFVLERFLKVALIIQLIALLYMGSRGSMLAIALVFLVLSMLTLKVRTIAALAAGFGAAIFMFVMLIQMFPDNVFSKEILRQYSIERVKESDHQRLAAWRIAVAKLATGEDLVWGVGPRNYNVINEMDFVRQNEELLQLKKFSHGHNLFITQLIEQGIIGLLAMLNLFFMFLLKIISIWRSGSSRAHAPDWSWYGGVGALSVPVIAGFFNTPFYQEHAMLAMLLMGMMFAIAKQNEHRAKN